MYQNGRSPDRTVNTLIELPLCVLCGDYIIRIYLIDNSFRRKHMREMNLGRSKAK